MKPLNFSFFGFVSSMISKQLDLFLSLNSHNLHFHPSPYLFGKKSIFHVLICIFFRKSELSTKLFLSTLKNTRNCHFTRKMYFLFFLTTEASEIIQLSLAQNMFRIPVT